MATEQVLECITLEAAETFVGKQFYVVYVDSNGKGAVGTGLTVQPIGIAQNTPAAGGALSIGIGGVSKIVSGAALTIGQQIGSDSAGQGTAITVAAGGTVYNYAVGRVITASAAASGLAEVVLYSGGLPLLV